MLIVFGIFILSKPAFSFKAHNPCHTVWEGCSIVNGRCQCSKLADSCFNPFTFSSLQHCLLSLFDTRKLENTQFPICKPAQYNPLCNTAHAGTRYCHGSCDSKCCVIMSRGCLPPTNIYVPAQSCFRVEKEDACQNMKCTKGYKCLSVKEPCSLFPCKKQPRCVVDDDYNPCPLVRCSQRKTCLRKRTKCGLDKCPYTFSCVPITFIRTHSRAVLCPNCPSVSLQESYCKNHFVVRLKVNELSWSNRWYKSVGICYWYSVTVEYILKHTTVLQRGNATLLIKSKTSSLCSCPGKVAVGERYFMIGNVLSSAYDSTPQVLHVPDHGYIKPWSLVKRRPQYLNFGECTNDHISSPDSPVFRWN